ncbi:MAG TPA: hypothetical protein VNH18_10880 [Bryobacteraceae bacterium]|nr:hypothetical protein [Bryobacteraceae bacterium]
MHELVREEIERHLAGKASPGFYRHLESCADCRTEVVEMEELSSILRDLTPAPYQVPSPSLGFYNRVAGTIREQQRSPLANLFSPGSLFFRRIALASLLLLTGLGGLLINSEVSEDGAGADATAIIAQYDATTSHAGASEPDRLLVTLAAYHQ